MTVKNQHYVWRKYLTAWSNEKKEAGKRRIYVLRKYPRGTQPAIESALLVNVASEKYFYDISGHEPEDQTVIKKLLDYMQREESVKLDINFQELSDASCSRDFLEKYVMSPNENIDNEYSFLERLQNDDLSFYHDSTAQQVMLLLNEQLKRCLYGGGVIIRTKSYSKNSGVVC